MSRAVMGCWSLIIFQLMFVLYDTVYAPVAMPVTENLAVMLRLYVCIALAILVMVLKSEICRPVGREALMVATLWGVIGLAAWLAVRENHLRCFLELYALGVVPLVGIVLMQLRFVSALVLSAGGMAIVISVALGVTMPYAHMDFAIVFVFMAFCLFSLIASFRIEFSARHAYLMTSIDQLRLQDVESRNAELQEMACLDPLTQLYNRRHLIEVLKQHHGDAQQAKSGVSASHPAPPLPCLALMMMDVDHFKAFNDHYGHVAGDNCLYQIAQALQETLDREKGAGIAGAYEGKEAALASVVRFGGEEFTALVAVRDLEHARSLAEAMRYAVKSLKLPHRESELGVVTLSVGLCVIPLSRLLEGEGMEDEMTRDMAVETLLSRWVDQADKGLYRAKRHGRNRTCVQRGNGHGKARAQASDDLRDGLDDERQAAQQGERQYAQHDEQKAELPDHRPPMGGAGLS
ncbi:GGDEF domain-containing protein [Cobetia sp. 1AS1]|uniref:GGDEF domain-containing protein n=1 Tax=Cobetia sp. 1AS1 TaxID=3040016 RepID=UPI0024483DFA|nr:GGDEF domain-containing protein [Cobetia sp. 1AS1]MDH2294363.1 GGDEF domain-containing protein [Cobetia sp. 1AS1]